MAEKRERLELRIHGVSNTPPHDVLGEKAADVGRVVGDELTGFWRPNRQPVHGVTREAYSWGSLNSLAKGTAAAASRAAWLLLLPFALVNVAYWARPGLTPMDGAKQLRNRAEAGAALMRVAGLTLTALLTSTATYVGVDLVGWQCHRGGDPLCPSLPSWTGFLADTPWDEPARRIAIGSVVPLSLLAVLWFISRQSLQRYEERPDPSVGEMMPIRRQLLEKLHFWSGSDRLLRLQRLHLALGIATVVVLSGYPVARRNEDTRLRVGSLTLPWLTTAAGVLLIAAVGWAAVAMTRDAPEFDPPDSGSRAPGRLLIAGFALLAGHLASLLGFYYEIPESGPDADLPGVGAAPLLLTGALVLLTGLSLHLSRVWAALFGVGVVLLAMAYVWAPDRLLAFGVIMGTLVLGGWAWHHWGKPSGDPSGLAWRGAGPGVLLGTAVACALLYTTATTIGAANWLNGDSGVGELVAHNRTSCPAVAKVNEPPCPALLTQRPADLESLVEGSTLSTTGDVTLEKGRVRVTATTVPGTARTGTTVTVVSGRLRAEQVLSRTADPPYDRRVPSARLTKGTVALTGAVLQLEDSVVIGAGGSSVDGQVAVPADGLRVATLDEKKPVDIVASEAGAAALSVPVTYLWLATALPFSVVGTVLVVGCAARLNRRRLRPTIAALLEVDGENLPSTGERLSGRMLSGRQFAALAHRPEVLIGAAGALVMVVTLIALAAAVTGTTPWNLNVASMLNARLDDVGLHLSPLEWLAEGDRYSAAMRLLADAGLYLAVAIGGLILVLGAMLQRNATVRRTVGIVWDLTAFWPRTAHPFGPPCYAERAVPDIYVRTTWFTSGELEAPVVLSGHSLGGVLAVAAIFRLPPAMRQRVALITYGSQLRLYLGRLFPDVLGPNVLGGASGDRPALTTPTVDETVVVPAPDTLDPVTVPPADGTLAHWLMNNDGTLRWVNLFRRTDPLGVRIWSDHPLKPPVRYSTAPYVNRVDRYVSEVGWPRPGDPTPPAINAHSGYPQTHEYDVALRACFSRLGRPLP
jgi:hypothetical protein